MARVDDLTEAELNDLLEPYDQTETTLRRKIVGEFVLLG